MIKQAFLALALGLAASQMASAAAPEASIRPLARGEAAPEMRLSTKSGAHLRPMLRPSDLIPVRLAQAVLPWMAPITSDDLAANTDGVIVTAAMGQALSLRPLKRPAEIEEKAFAKRRALRKGMVCGDRGIQGEEVGYVPGRISGCGIRNAVRVTSIEGVKLSQPSLMDCNTAEALQTWVNRGLKPQIGNRGGGVARIRVAAHYACRSRNNQPGAKISEHGKGRAIDISGVRLKDGTFVSVLEGWGTRKDGRLLRNLHARACGPFGTVLGPESDAFHKDHFHFDTARYRSGAYCR
jgi:hypothetical protein